jgi:hypothetical protein
MPRAKTPRTTTARKHRKKTNGELPAVEVNIDMQPAFNLDEEIRRRAYELYLARGGRPGNPHEDWLRAEQQVRQRAQQAKV